jgi:hypothetical protein
MSHAVHRFTGGSFKALGSAGVVCLMLGAGGAEGAVGQSSSRPGVVADEATFQTAARRQHQLAAADDNTARCEPTGISQAVSLIYQFDDIPGALAIARRCEMLAITQGRPDFKTGASRIKALAAIRVKDMEALRSAGEALVAEAPSPEFIADGHLFIAFACTFSGRAVCARTHLDQAKVMFVRHDVAGALEQLMSVEQALLKLEASGSQ